MQSGKVLGKTRATVKHPSLNGQRLLVVQPLGVDGVADGPPLIVVDQLGAGRGDEVILTSDGPYGRVLVNDERTPIRWYTLGLVDS
ncbi:EutN/CcmL family microcompartment protein [Planctomycetaceae bacterium SH139]